MLVLCSLSKSARQCWASLFFGKDSKSWKIILCLMFFECPKLFRFNPPVVRTKLMTSSGMQTFLKLLVEKLCHRKLIVVGRSFRNGVLLYYTRGHRLPTKIEKVTKNESVEQWTKIISILQTDCRIIHLIQNDSESKVHCQSVKKRACYWKYAQRLLYM